MNYSSIDLHNQTGSAKNVQFYLKITQSQHNSRHSAKQLFMTYLRVQVPVCYLYYFQCVFFFLSPTPVSSFTVMYM